jgi:16S rRNA (adenine1518-N6/adenine1519-N6)-dimethyltransferase
LPAKRHLGQHFLEPQWAEKLIAAINPQASDRFLEIGPGPGALTLKLAPKVAHLTAIEVDRDMVSALAPQVPSNVRLVEADFLKADLSALLASGPLRVAGNLPYNIASPILLRLVAAHRAAGSHASTLFVDATVMVQREVADRLDAAPGTKDYGVLTISVRMRADVRRVLELPPGAFRPPPKVHSSVVRLTFRPPSVSIHDEQRFESMVRSMFTQRRKTLANALAPFAAAHGTDARTALAAAGIDARRRAETLDMSELARLSDEFAR